MDASDLSSRSDNSLNSMPSNEPNGTEDLSKSQYKDLLDIVNFQKMKISQIETDLKKVILSSNFEVFQSLRIR